MINKINPVLIQLLIVVASSLMFIPFLGGVHLFDWDEINFAEAAREMIVTGDYINVKINYLSFWEKPPLFIWMQVVSMKTFGINEFAARFPNAISGVLTLLILFKIGKKLKDNLFGVLWVLAFAGSILPFVYFKSGIIDPWFNLFIFLGIYFLLKYAYPESKNKIRDIILAALFAGLAVLTKGPVGFLLIAITGAVFLITIQFKLKVRLIDVLVYLIVFSLVGGLWFIIQLLNGNSETIIDFIDYQVWLFQAKGAGHGGFFGYHFVLLLLTVFPSSILALKSFRKEKADDPFFCLMKKWMVILFWVVLIIFSIVQTKIVHYSSLAYFPLTFLAANFVYKTHLKGIAWSRWISVLIVFVSFLIAIPVVLLQFVDKYKDEIISNNWIEDEFVKGNLSAEVNWSNFEFIPGLLFFLAVISIFLFIKKDKVLKRAILLWSATLIFTFTVIIVFIPKIEKYSQNALIEFFKSLEGKDVYIKNLHFKSYAPYFYGKTIPVSNSNFYDQNWLLSGDIDKDVYFVSKIQHSDKQEEFPELEQIGQKNGFVFYIRKAKEIIQ